MRLEWTQRIVSVVSCLFVICTSNLSAEASYPLLSVTQNVWGKGATEDEYKIDIEAGETLYFSIGVSNSGDLPAQDVLLLTHLPQGLNYVPGSLSMNGGALPEVPLCVVAHDRVLAFHGITVPSKGMQDQTTGVSFQVKVSDTLPPRAVRLQTATQAIYLGDPVLANVAFGDERTTTSTPVIMTITKRSAPPKPAILPYAVLDITQEVAGATQPAAKRAHVCQGDVVTFMMKIRNSGDKASPITLWNTMIPKGMTYVENSAHVDGNPISATLSGPMLFGDISVAAKGEIGDSITFSFEVQVDNPLPEDITRLSSYSMLSYFGNPDSEGSVAVSNSVTLFPHK